MYYLSIFILIWPSYVTVKFDFCFKNRRRSLKTKYFVASNSICNSISTVYFCVQVLYNFKRNSVRYCLEQIVHCLYLLTPFFLLSFKGQLQRFHKLISNDRIWPSEHGFEVIFEKSLFVFEISAFKVRNKRGIHSRFHSFSENNNRETFVCDVTSDQSSMISTERSDLRDHKASGNC